MNHTLKCPRKLLERFSNDRQLHMQMQQCKHSWVKSSQSKLWLIHKVLIGHTPECLTNMSTPASTALQLSRNCTIIRMITDRAFSTAAWNWLLTEPNLHVQPIFQTFFIPCHL